MLGTMHRLDSPPVAEFFDRLAAAGRGCLMLDYDGTLAPFTAERDAAAPFPGTRESLNRIIDSGRTTLAIVSGRAVAEVRALLGLEHGLQYWGSHGAEQIDTDGSYSSYELSQEQSHGIHQAYELLKQLVPPEQIERKPFSVALHWRGIDVKEAGYWRDQVQPKWEELARAAALAVHQFNGGIEVRPPDATKAAAVRSIIEQCGAGCPAAYLGDDLTDEDAFAELGSEGLAVLVGDEPRASRADVFLRRFDEVLLFLERWGDRCR